MDRESDDELIEDALRARASLAGAAAGGAEELVGPGFGSAYRLGGLKDYGEDLASDDEGIDDGIDEESGEDELPEDDDSARS